jgi:electron-transferring-flavoprotein dehydrogenase
LLYNDAKQVVGIATGDQGVGKDGKPKSSFVRGMELRGKQTLLAEGARGSLSQSVMATYNLRKVFIPTHWRDRGYEGSFSRLVA